MSQSGIVPQYLSLRPSFGPQIKDELNRQACALITGSPARTLTVKDIVQNDCLNQPLIIEFRFVIMAKSKEVQMEDLKENLAEISEELGNICDELSELNSNLGMIGTMITIDLLVKMRPEMKDKVAPLINELVNGLAITLSDLDEEEIP
jgi:hypothetical protein